MSFAIFLFTLDWLVAIICLLLLAAGLVRITSQRQTEVLKEYLQPDKLKIEHLIMRSGNPLSANDTDTASEDPQQQASQDTTAPD